MQKNILITGLPKSGKSSLLNKVIGEIPNKVGFVTKEIRVNGERVGFEIETHLGEKAVLSHIDFETPYKVSRYFVDVDALESVIPKVSGFGEKDILYLDEIGQMQAFSEKFKRLALSFLDSKNTCLATLSAVYEDDFIKSIKRRDDIILVSITETDREEKEKFVRQLLRKIEKAKKYLSEPERFTRDGKNIVLKSEHATRTLVPQGDTWACDCDFYGKNAVCSHVIATNEFVKNFQN